MFPFILGYYSQIEASVATKTNFKKVKAQTILRASYLGIFGMAIAYLNQTLKLHFNQVSICTMLSFIFSADKNIKVYTELKSHYTVL